MQLLELGGPDVALQLVVISRRQQILSTDYFEHFELDMADCSTAVVKSRGHFRAGFQHFVPDAGVLEVDVPGAHTGVLPSHFLRPERALRHRRFFLIP